MQDYDDILKMLQCHLSISYQEKIYQVIFMYSKFNEWKDKYLYKFRENNLDIFVLSDLTSDISLFIKSVNDYDYLGTSILISKLNYTLTNNELDSKMLKELGESLIVIEDENTFTKPLICFESEIDLKNIKEKLNITIHQGKELLQNDNQTKKSGLTFDQTFEVNDNMLKEIMKKSRKANDFDEEYYLKMEKATQEIEQTAILQTKVKNKILNDETKYK